MIAAVLILIGWVLYVSSKQIERGRRIQEEIRALETEATKIHRENETLSERISYFATDDYREQVAKNQLGMKKIGETVIEVKPTRLDQGSLAPGYEEAGNVSSGVEQGLSGNNEDGSVPNYKKWWRVFFGIY